tara:strand:+ start:1330 stop:1515 length:186 start_codon:yes stop_codon:yes gene_type:complete
MAKKIKTPLSAENLFPSKLYVCMCIDAILKMQTGEETTDKKIIELLVPLLDEYLDGKEFLA